MTLISPVNLTESSLSQTVGLAQDTSAATASAPSTGIGAVAPTVDEFTLSTQAAGEPIGLFNVNQVSLFSPAAQALLLPITNAAIVAANAQAASAIATPTATPAGSGRALQQLNSDMEALGLDSASISKIDAIASLINNFNPATFAALAYQLESQQPAPPSAATKAVPAQAKTATA